MNYRSVRIRNLAGFLVVGVFSLCLATSTRAQGKPAGAGPPPNNNPNISDRVRQIDEGKLRGAEANAGVEEENQERVQAAIVNMKDDYRRIQVLRNDIARNLVARKPLEYKLVADQAAEINKRASRLNVYMQARVREEQKPSTADELDRKSTRLNSSHLVISYAVFCLKKKQIMSISPQEILDHGASVLINAPHGQNRRLSPDFML